MQLIKYLQGLCLLLIFVFSSCKPPANKKSETTIEKKFLNELGIMYGPVKSVTEIIKEAPEDPEIRITYDYSEKKRELIRNKELSTNSTIFYDANMEIDSLVINSTNGSRNTNIYHKVNYYNDYHYYRIGSLLFTDTFRIEQDIPQRLVRTYFGGRFTGIDSFDTSGFLVKRRNILGNSVDTFTYNDRGHCTMQYSKLLHLPDQYRKVENSYEYDKFGNWIKRVQKVVATDVNYNATIITTRMISYDE